MGQLTTRGISTSGTCGNGEFHHCVPPFGYLYSNGSLEIDEAEAGVVRRIFDLCVNEHYGRLKIARTLNAEKIWTRKGLPWGESNIGRLLHNSLYMGIPHGAEDQSKIIPALQIIDSDLFHKAQKQQMERIPSRNDEKKRTVFCKDAMMPSGAFCGHCGSRLFAIVNHDTRVNACGEKTHRERLRYECYGKTRPQTPCSGQSSYTAPKLDKMVEGVICQILGRSPLFTGSAPESSIQLAIDEFREQLDMEKFNHLKFSTDYNDAVAELSSAEYGRNELIVDKLREFSEYASGAFHKCDGRISTLQSHLKQAELQLDNVRNLAPESRMQKWSVLFSNADMSVKRRVFGLLVKKVTVYSGYRVHIKLNIDASQGDLGLDVAPSSGFVPSGIDKESVQVSFANKFDWTTIRTVKRLLCNVGIG